MLVNAHVEVLLATLGARCIRDSLRGLVREDRDHVGVHGHDICDLVLRNVRQVPDIPKWEAKAVDDPSLHRLDRDRAVDPHFECYPGDIGVASILLAHHVCEQVPAFGLIGHELGVLRNRVEVYEVRCRRHGTALMELYRSLDHLWIALQRSRKKHYFPLLFAATRTTSIIVTVRCIIFQAASITADRGGGATTGPVRAQLRGLRGALSPPPATVVDDGHGQDNPHFYLMLPPEAGWTGS